MDDFERLADLVRTTDLSALLSAAEDILGAERILVATHDLDRLVDPITGDHLDIGVEVERLWGDMSVEHEAGVFTVLDTRPPFPVAVAVNRIDADRAAVVGSVITRRHLDLEALEINRRRKRMAPTAQLQWDQLTTPALTTQTVEIAGVLEPAYEVAGDLFDIAVDPSGVPVVAILDSMGHGMLATEAATLTLAALRTSRRHGDDLTTQAATANTALWERYDGDRFVTLALLRFDDDGIGIVNAGHEPLRRVGQDGAEMMDVEPTPPLGVQPDWHGVEHRLPGLRPGEALVALTDGGPEARSPDGVELGEAGMASILVRQMGSSSLQAAHRIASRVVEHVGGGLSDDLTVVVVRNRNERESSDG